MHWLLLALAIVFELIGTISMKQSAGFTRLWPSLAVVAGYGLSSVWLTLALRSLPLGVTYAIWSGVGTACAVAVGAALYQEALSPVKLVSLAFIVLGVIGLRLG